MENPTEDISEKLNVSYKLLFERNPLPMWVYDVETLQMLAVNDAALTKYGYSKQEFVGLTLLDLHHPDDGAVLNEHLKLPIEKQGGTRLWKHRHRNGELIEVEMVTEVMELDGTHASMALVRDLTAQRRAEQAQQDLAKRLTTTFESITDAFYTLDRDWRFTYVNARAEDMLRVRREDLLGCNVWEKFPGALGTIFQREFERAMTDGTTTSFEGNYASFLQWREVYVYPSSQGLAVYFRDVTDRRDAEQRLVEQRETLAAVINAATDAIISIDGDGLVQIFNPSAERIFCRTLASMQGQTLDVLLPERFRVAHGPLQHLFSELGEPSRVMGMNLVKGLRSDGREIDLEITISRVTIRQKQVLIANLRDVSERVLVDAEIEQSRAQLSDLTQRLMTQEKTLVKRLAQALHDQLGQTIAAIRMVHETMMTLQEAQTTLGIGRLQAQMCTLISQAIRQVRQVLIDLRPPMLEEHGLAAAIDNELRNRSMTQPQVDISIYVPSEIALMRWPTEVEYAAFMVARESVENALRHSGASSLDVRLMGTAMSLQLEVSDNGVGITAGAKPQTGHLGILSMQERAQSIGATLTVASSDGQGACVRFNWQPSP